jgi:hypothetical protein
MRWSLRKELTHRDLGGVPEIRRSIIVNHIKFSSRRRLDYGRDEEKSTDEKLSQTG